MVKFGRKFYVIKNFDENTSTIINCVVDSHKQMPPHIISAFSSSLNLILLFVNLPCFIFLNLAPEMVKFRRKFIFIVKFSQRVSNATIHLISRPIKALPEHKP